jgi:cation diffusion facilitator family transporter
VKRRRRHVDRSARKVLYAGLAGNVLVAATKFGAAAVTSIAAMLSEAVHSAVDTSNELLLLYGERAAQQPPDKHHPFGHGREVYFWGFIVSLLIFVIGAGVSIVEGVRHILAAERIENPAVSYAVLGLAAVFEGGSWWVAWKEFRKRRGDRGVIEAAQETKDPSSVMVFFEDSAALIGIAIALAGTALAQALDEPRWDGAASIAIGVLLALVAGFLARETKQLLIGEGARRSVLESVGRIASAEKGVAHFNGMLTVHLAPREVFAALSLDFDPKLRVEDVNAVVASLEEHIRKAHPEVVMVMVKPQSPDDFRQARDRWFAPR